MASSESVWIRLSADTYLNDGGDGLFAARDISQGCLIYTEFPGTEATPRGEPTPDEGRDLPNSDSYRSSVSSRGKYNTNMRYTIFGKSPSCKPVRRLRPREIFDGVTRESGDSGILVIKPSCVNHSCAPNISRVDSSDLETKRLKCQFFALGDIKEGDELTIAYEPVIDLENVSLRRALLEAEYGFFCRCFRCASEAELRDSRPLLPARNNFHLEVDVAKQVNGTENQSAELEPATIWNPEVPNDLVSRKGGIIQGIQRIPQKLNSFVKDIQVKPKIKRRADERRGVKAFSDIRDDDGRLIEKRLCFRRS